MQNFEYNYDERTVLFGDVIESNDSFDHEFGTERVVTYDVENFSIIVYINDIDHDVTRSFKEDAPKFYEQYKQDLINKYIDAIS